MKNRSLRSNIAGNVGVMFAFCATILVGVCGVAIDTIRTQNEKANLNAAADAAALAAATFIRDNPELDISALKASAKSQVLAMWDANLSEQQKQRAGVPNVEIADDLSVAVSYDGKIETSFSSVLGFGSLNLSGKAVASGGSSDRFWDFSFAVDTSSSMGIGATQVDMNAMQADPKIGCSFACHNSASGNDTMALARTGGYKLRIDVVGDAVDATIDAIAAKPRIKPKAALFGMDKQFVELVPSSAQLNNVRKHQIDIAYTANFKGNSNYRAGLEGLTDKVGVSGDGSSASKARKVVFIVGDGLHDTPHFEPNVVYHWDSNHKLGPIDPNFCKEMKDNGVLVGVLYVKYIVPSMYAFTIAGFKDDMLPKMEACASPGFFHNATSPEEMKTAMTNMLSKAFETDVRLSQ